jgi:hypothetical protein
VKLVYRYGESSLIPALNRRRSCGMSLSSWNPTSELKPGGWSSVERSSKLEACFKLEDGASLSRPYRSSTYADNWNQHGYYPSRVDILRGADWTSTRMKIACNISLSYVDIGTSYRIIFSPNYTMHKQCMFVAYIFIASFMSNSGRMSNAARKYFPSDYSSSVHKITKSLVSTCCTVRLGR